MNRRDAQDPLERATERQLEAGHRRARTTLRLVLRGRGVAMRYAGCRGVQSVRASGVGIDPVPAARSDSLLLGGLAPDAQDGARSQRVTHIGKWLDE